MKRLPATEDILAILGVILIAAALAIRVGPDVAVGFVGAALLLYAVLSVRTEVRS